MLNLRLWLLELKLSLSKLCLRKKVAASIKKYTKSKSKKRFYLFPALLVATYENTWDGVSWEKQHDWYSTVLNYWGVSFYNFWDFCPLASLNYESLHFRMFLIFGRTVNYYPNGYLYELYISEGKITKRKLLIQSKTHRSFRQQSEHRSLRNMI